MVGSPVRRLNVLFPRARLRKGASESDLSGDSDRYRSAQSNLDLTIATTTNIDDTASIMVKAEILEALITFQLLLAQMPP
jgi:hypothetical protein